MLKNSKSSNGVSRDNSLVATTLGLDRIDVGVDSGYLIERDRELIHKIEGKEIYNSAKQFPKNWIILDLETGSRGWYPGCVTQSIINYDKLNMYVTESSESSIVAQLSRGSIIKILTILDNTAIAATWYQVEFNNLRGYIQKQYIDNIIYTDPV